MVVVEVEQNLWDRLPEESSEAVQAWVTYPDLDREANPRCSSCTVGKVGAINFSLDHTVKLGDPETGDVMATFTCDVPARCCAFSEALKVIVRVIAS